MDRVSARMLYLASVVYGGMPVRDFRALAGVKRWRQLQREWEAVKDSREHVCTPDTA